jgi:valyl-tRNA synthetase
VYLHGTVRDTNHVKMSKSLGNGIDPLDVVRDYGADALRYTVIAGMGLGADTILDPNDLERSFAPGRNFVTKLWNIGRFLLTNVGSDPVMPLDTIPAPRLTRADRWILGRLNEAIRACDVALGPARPQGTTWTDAERYAGLRLNEYTEAARGFAWSELADWYLESVKARLTKHDEDREVARSVLVHAFDQVLRLLQPIVPFVTDALWQRLPRTEEAALAIAAWPTVGAIAGDAREFDLVIETVNAIRRLRADYSVPPGKPVSCTIVPSSASRSIITDEASVAGRLGRAEIVVADAAPSESSAHAVLSDGTQVILSLAGVVDVERECTRLRGELASLEKQLDSLRGRLKNENFLARAKPDVVEAERQKEGEWSSRRELLADKVRALCGG